MKHLYTLKQHIDKIELILELISKSTALEGEQQKFNYINLLADFVSCNKQYNDIPSFLALVEKVVDIIEYCNSETYFKNDIQEKLDEVVNNLKYLLEEVKSLYNINLYFKGKDKYGLIDKIINKNINLITNRETTNSENIFDVLVVSEETCNDEIDTSGYQMIMDYDSFMNKCFSEMEKIYHRYYDFYYLSNSLDIAKQPHTKGIIVGASYPLHGINESKLMGNIVKLTLASQDFYYSFKAAKDVIEENSNIKKCIIGTGYWSFHADTSKSPKDGFARIEEVYYPLFKDSHNYNYIEKTEKLSLQDMVDKCINYIFDMNKLGDELAKILFKSYKGYFNNIRTRERCSLIGSKNLRFLTESEKIRLASERVGNHNRLRTYGDRKEENVTILREFMEYLCSKSVKPIIVNFINTDYYSRFLDKEYISEYKEIISDLKKTYKFEFIDLYDYKTFTDKDFVDFDHMSDLGADKVSKILSII